MLSQGFQCFTSVDLKWPWTSIKINGHHLLNIANTHTKFDTQPTGHHWEIVVASKVSQTHTYIECSHDLMDSSGWHTIYLDRQNQLSWLGSTYSVHSWGNFFILGYMCVFMMCEAIASLVQCHNIVKIYLSQLHDRLTNTLKMCWFQIRRILHVYSVFGTDISESVVDIQQMCPKNDHFGGHFVK